PRLAGEVRELGGTMSGQSEHGNQPGTEQAERRAHELRDVAELHERPIARPQPERQEARCRRLRPAPELRIGPTRVAADHGQAVRHLLGPLLQESRKRFAVPVARIAIPLRERRRPHLSHRNHVAASIPPNAASSMPSASSSAANLAAVSFVSVAGSEPSTMPAPAYKRTRESSISA